MYDGRVVIAGSNMDAQRPFSQRELSIEIYTPDNLWRGPRPEFVATPDEIGYGAELHIRLTNNWKYGQIKPERIGLIRTCACTHAFTFDQRYVALHAYTEKGKSFPSPNDTEFVLRIPNDPNVLPPGYYMLFLLSKIESPGIGGAPSLAKIVKIG
jgi:hypothetical protein